MSINFWVELVLAVTGFGLAIAIVQAHKRGLLRMIRAKWLRRRIVRTMQHLLPLISHLADTDERPENEFALFRLRAELESLLSHGGVLLEEEQRNLADFLGMLSVVFARRESTGGSIQRLDELILLGQRTIHESAELGF